jgi:hypothetical protein
MKKTVQHLSILSRLGLLLLVTMLVNQLLPAAVVATGC